MYYYYHFRDTFDPPGVWLPFTAQPEIFGRSRAEPACSAPHARYWQRFKWSTL